VRLDHQISITKHDISDLQPSPRNARTHSDRQIAEIASSISNFGFVNPVLVDEKGQIIAGHGRYAAAKRLGLTEVPAIVLDHLSATQKKALMLADNKIALNAGWDETLLAAALEEILIEDIDFDVTSMGFATAEIDLFLDPDRKAPDPADDFEEAVPGAPVVTRPGDIWVLGKHRIICGDALDPRSYSRLLGDGKAQMAITDPPFNVKIDGHVSGLGKRHHREFAMASGEMTPAAFTDFLATTFARIRLHSAKGGIAMVFMDWRHLPEILDAGRKSFSALVNLCVWKKSNAGMGSLYRSQHELCLIFKAVPGSHVNNVELGRHGRYRTNVWEYAGANAFGRSRDQDLEDHPTVKPVAMIADAIKDCSTRGGLVLDPFGGSGTTLLAAERSGRRGRLIELEPGYVDVTLRRWCKLVKGGVPLLEATGETFAVIEAKRLEEVDPTPNLDQAQRRPPRGGR
jgi:DNA modification methylase